MRKENELSVTVIGGDFLDDVEFVFGQVGINPVNEIKEGRLGNFKTFTYIFEIPENQIIEKRKKLMGEIQAIRGSLMTLYRHGDWMDLYVMKWFEH